MKTLSLDQSLNKCAYIVWENSQMIEYGIIKTSPQNGEIEDRILIVSNAVLDIINKYDIEQVFLEGLTFSSISTSVRPLAGLFYSLLIVFKKEQIPYKYFPPTEIKKFATTKGNAKKEQIIDALPLEIKNLFLLKAKKTSGLDDLADAYFIGQYGIITKKGV